MTIGCMGSTEFQENIKILHSYQIIRSGKNRHTKIGACGFNGDAYKSSLFDLAVRGLCSPVNAQLDLRQNDLYDSVTNGDLEHAKIVLRNKPYLSDLSLLNENINNFLLKEILQIITKKLIVILPQDVHPIITGYLTDSDDVFQILRNYNRNIFPSNFTFILSVGIFAMILKAAIKKIL